MSSSASRRAVRWGWILLAVFLPLGMTLEALHAMKVQVYLGSPMRRELWTLAHAHGNLLGILCLAFGALCDRTVAEPAARESISRWLLAGAWSMPVGFFLGGILNHEGDPSWGIALVPLGAVCLLVALVRTALSAQSSAD